MRTPNELLQILIDNINKLEYGLSELSLQLCTESVITKDECDYLEKFLVEKTKEKYNTDIPMWLFLPGKCNKKQRIEFLNAEIQKNGNTTH